MYHNWQYTLQNGDTAVTIANELGQEQMLQELLHRQ